MLSDWLALLFLNLRGARANSQHPLRSDLIGLLRLEVLNSAQYKSIHCFMQCKIIKSLHLVMASHGPAVLRKLQEIYKSIPSSLIIDEEIEKIIVSIRQDVENRIAESFERKNELNCSYCPISHGQFPNSQAQPAGQRHPVRYAFGYIRHNS